MKPTGKNKKRTVERPTLDADGYQTNIRDLNGTPLPDLDKVRAKPFWGGARKGAGRKSTGRQPILLRLTPRTVRRLRTAARQQGKTISDVAEARLGAASGPAS